jgi:hypothetical protein
MALDRDPRDQRRRDSAKSANEELDRALEAAVEDEAEGLSEDAGLETFLDRFPAAVRTPTRPKPNDRRCSVTDAGGRLTRTTPASRWRADRKASR